MGATGEGYVDVVLRDGRSIRIRQIRPDDRQRLKDLFYRLSPRTRYLRFQYTKTYLSEEELDHYTTISPPSNNAFLGTMRVEGEERIVAVARWYLTADPSRAEVSFVVDDNIQVRGLGTALLERLAEAALKYRINTFVAAVLVENTMMLEVFEQSGFRTVKALEGGVYSITMDLREKEAFDLKQAYREHVARVAGARKVLYPRNVAVIGASREPESVGGAVFRNMLECDFQGAVFPVNPKARSIGGVLAYPSVLDIPVEVDLAVVVVPARAVLDVVDQCGKKGVEGMIIISAGFGEAGGEGRELERQLSEKVVGYGIRLVGPNCLGVINTEPGARLNATFSPVFPPAGNLSICTQSGALGLALIDYAKGLDLGLDHFVSIGNRVDISNNDLLEFWEDDPGTEVILLYLESFGNPRKFSRIARRVSRKKPVIAVKAGKSEVGARAAASHTGALAAQEVAVEAMFRQAGVIRVDTIEEMFNTARAMVNQPFPRGNRVGILTNAGGPGVLAADACEGWGLVVPPLSEETQKKMREFLPAAASVANPVDMIASAHPEHYARCLALMLDDQAVDSVIVIYIPPLVTRPENVAASIREALEAYKGDKPVLNCFMMLQRPLLDMKLKGGRRAPMFTFPEDAVQALARAYQHFRYTEEEAGRVPVFEDIERERARKSLFAAVELTEEGAWLMPEAAFALLREYGIPVPDTRVVMSAEEAEAVASEMGFPLAMKLRSLSVTHKTEVKGVSLGLRDAGEVARAYRDLSARMAAHGAEGEMQGVVLQRMVEGGRETIVGMSQDPVFGPIVMVGLGGVHVELLRDIAFSLHPLMDVDPGRMLGRLKGLPLLQGWRGSTPGDVEALKDVLLRFSAMVEDLPELDQVDINPLFVLDRGKGCVAVDARMRVRKPAANALG